MPAALYILFGAAFTIAFCFGAGRLLLARLRLPLDRAETHLFAFLLGAVLVSNLIFLLCALHLEHRGVLMAMGAGVIWLGARASLPSHIAPKGMVGRWRYLLLAAGLAYGFLYLFNAMAPEISPDGSTYHLSLVSRYVREHGFPRITNNMYANLSQGVEMLFLAAFTFGRHSASAMVHFGFLVALPAAILLYARRIGFPLAGTCAALFVFASPVVGKDGISAYVDVAAACAIFGVFYLLEIWDAERSSGLLIAAGLLAGYAYAAKYTAGLAVPYAAGVVAWKSWRGRKSRLKPVLTVVLCAVAVMLPWMVKNWMVVENPFSPFLNALFPNPYILAGFEREYSYELRHDAAIRGLSELPWAVTVDGRLSGLVGPLFLLAPLGLLCARPRLLLAALLFSTGIFMNQSARFLIPALPFFALAMALVFTRWKPLAPVLAILHAVLGWPGVMPLYCAPTAWRLDSIPVRAALRIEPEDRFLDAHLANYRMARLVERTVPAHAAIFAWSQVAEAYTRRNILVGYQSASNQVLQDVLQSALFEALWPQGMLEFRFRPATVRRLRVVQTARSQTDRWSVSELRVFRGEAELPREPAWRLHARPNPWQIQLAFDNTPVTRWRTWQPIAGGEFVEIDFGRAQPVDRVLVECSRDQGKIKLRLEAADESGRWQTLADALRVSDRPPIPQLKRMATEELKLRGVSYMVVYHDDFGARDFRSHPDEWGIVPVGVLGDERLYKIE
jgi:4-amino-4-deoxy-L-arabinose transferase-like glycosyltransferase